MKFKTTLVGKRFWVRCLETDDGKILLFILLTPRSFFIKFLCLPAFRLRASWPLFAIETSTGYAS